MWGLMDVNKLYEQVYRGISSGRGTCSVNRGSMLSRLTATDGSRSFATNTRVLFAPPKITALQQLG